MLSNFEGYAKKAMREWHVPGMAAAIIKSDRLVYARGFGVKMQHSGEQVNPKTVFQAGSVSKSFTAALLSMLVDEGKLAWQDRVKKHLPNFWLYDTRAAGEFTVGDLLAQHSGLPPHSGRLLPHLGFKRDYIINSLRYIKPTGCFRSTYAYQNNLFLVAAAVVEKKTGKSWEENLAERILKPLGLQDTTAALAGYRNCRNAAMGHYYNGPGPDSPVTAIPKNWPYHYWVYTVAPAGGINTNVLDLAKWLRLHLTRGTVGGKRLLSEQSIRFLLTPQTFAGQGPWQEKRHYCRGWLRSEYHPYPVLWHNGGTSGMKSIMAMVPEAQLGIVILCNLYDSLLPEALCRVLLDRWFKKKPRDWSRELLAKQKACSSCLGASPAPDMPHRPFNCYTGTYYNRLYGPVTIARTGNSLTVIMGPQKITKRLTHWGGDTFVLYWPGVLTGGAGVQFYPGRTGIMNTIKIEGMNDDLTGSFIR